MKEFKIFKSPLRGGVVLLALFVLCAIALYACESETGGRDFFRRARVNTLIKEIQWSAPDLGRSRILAGIAKFGRSGRYL